MWNDILPTRVRIFCTASVFISPLKFKIRFLSGTSHSSGPPPWRVTLRIFPSPQKVLSCPVSVSFLHTQADAFCFLASSISLVLGFRIDGIIQSVLFHVLLILLGIIVFRNQWDTTYTRKQRAQTQNPDNLKGCETAEPQKPSSVPGPRGKMLPPPWKTVGSFLPEDPGIPPFDSFPKGLRPCVLTKTCTHMLRAAFFIIAPT